MNFAIIGASGNVGRKTIEILEKSRISFEELYLVASKKVPEKKLKFEGKKLLLETHIFNFNDDIYGKELTVEFLTFIRPEQKFDNFEKLTEQIKKDILTAKSYHKI